MTLVKEPITEISETGLNSFHGVLPNSALEECFLIIKNDAFDSSGNKFDRWAAFDSFEGLIEEYKKKLQKPIFRRRFSNMSVKFMLSEQEREIILEVYNQYKALL
jgi:hypothetical protein